MSIETFRRHPSAADEDTAAPITPGSFSVTTQMMQDAVRAIGVSAGDGINQEALFANPFKQGREEALVITPAGRLTYLQRTESSDTGWAQQDVEGTPLVAEVLAVVHPSGEVWAICSPRDGAATPFGMVLTLDGETAGTAQCSWANRVEFNIEGYYARSLCVSYSPDSGPLVLGSTLDISGGASFFVLLPQLPAFSGNGTAWALHATTMFAPGFPIVGGGFLPYYPATGQRNVYVYYFLNGKQLLRYEESAGQFRGPFEVSRTVDQFCGTYYVPNLNQDNPQGDVGFAYLDGLYLVTGSFMAPGHHLMLDPVVGTGFDTAARARVWQDADGLLHVFGTSSDQGGAAGNLQVLHQSTWQTIDRGVGPDRARVVQPAWTSAKVASAPSGIGGYDLMAPQDRLVAFDYTGHGKADCLLAYRPGARVVWVVGRTSSPGGFDRVYHSESGLPGYDFSSPRDQVVAYDYTGTGSAHCLLAYRPGAGKFAIFRKQAGAGGFTSVVSAASGGIGEPGRKYDLADAADRLVPFDYTGSGKNDHLLAYRPGTGTAWVLAPRKDGTFHPAVTSATGLGGFSLNNPADIVVGLDYNSSGSNTHLLAYRPGAGMAYILTADKNGVFVAEVESDTHGLGGYDLIRPNDRLVPFDFSGLGKNDHILAYRPGDVHKYGDQTVWILKRDRTAPTEYTRGIWNRYGIGGYDFASPADTVTPYDYGGTGSLAYLIAYRPGAGKVSVMGQRGGHMAPVYQAPPGPSTFVTVGLHADIIDFQLDPYPDFKPSELIKMSGMSPAEAYCVCTQDVTTSQWQTDKVRIPPRTNQDPFVVSHYVAEATLLSTEGKPMNGHRVSVSADSLVEVQIDEVSYQVGPGRSIAVTTNPSGKLVVSIAARGLNPPVVHLNADNLQQGAAIDFAAQANSFLAGESTLPSQKGKFSAGLLKDAKVTPNDMKLGAGDLADWPALEERGLTPQVVVDHCTNMYAQAAGNEELRLTFDGESAEPVVGYVIQLWDPDRPAFQAFRNQDEIDAYRGYRNGHPAYGGWWDDFTSWASDVWEGIKTGATKVAEVLVSAIVEIAVWIGDAVVSLGEMIIEAIEQAIQAVEAVFQMIADAIMRVIDWLKSLFDMTDIWDTKKAIQSCVTDTVLPLSKTMISNFGMRSEQWFQDQRPVVKQYFDLICAQYSDTRVGDFPNKSGDIPTESGGSVAKGDLSTPQANWMQNKALGANDLPSSFADVLDIGDGPLLGDFKKFVSDLAGDQAWTDLLSDLGTIWDALTDFLDPGDAGTTSSAKVVNLLRAVQEFVDDFLVAAGKLVKKFVDFTVKVVEEVVALLVQPLEDMGFVETLYTWVQTAAGVKPEEREKPSILGLASLIMAFFVTTLYKLVNGVDNPPFPGGRFVTIPIPSFDEATTGEPDPQDPAENMRLVEFQCSAIPAGVMLAVVVGLTDLLKGPTNWIPSWNKKAIAEEILNVCEIVGTAWAYALSIPSVTAPRKPWDGWGIAGCTVKSVAFVLDIVTAVVSLLWDNTGKVSSLLKNLGYDADEDPVKAREKAAASLVPGSIIQLAFGLGVLTCNVGGTETARNTDPELPPALYAMAMAESVLDAAPRACQVIRNITLHKAVPKGVWALVSVCDGVMAGASLILQGAAASDAHVHRPQPVETARNISVTRGEKFDVAVFSGGDSIFQGSLVTTLVDPVLPAGVNVENGHISGTFPNDADHDYTVKVQTRDRFTPPMYAETTVQITVK
ncbi:hypothetical protein ACGFT2_07930 [Streptomyces sp. NPDC048514]|uniref:hypothetical protein n=1 Tax=Streptomyces sp. NPDC048514 TaxID=3365564 RepID=UPI00371CE9BA